MVTPKPGILSTSASVPPFRQTWIPSDSSLWPCSSVLPICLSSVHISRGIRADWLEESPPHEPEHQDRGRAQSICQTLCSSLPRGSRPLCSVVSPHPTSSSHGPSLLLCLLFCELLTAWPCSLGNNVSVLQTTMSFRLRHTGPSAPWDSIQRVLCATQGCELLALLHWCC